MDRSPMPCCSDFSELYDRTSHPAFRELERTVLGGDYGATSWTTRQQADEMQQALGISDTTRVLEVGSGTGWPAVYLAGQTGCHLTLIDLPDNALNMAMQRAAGQDLTERITAVQASGADIPFADRSFDVICHSDVLCCLPEKREVLKECRRVGHEGASMYYFVIAPAEGLNGDDYAEAIDAGPPYVELEGDYASITQAAGWIIQQRTDVTAMYLQCLDTMVNGLKDDRTIFQQILGEEEFGETLKRRQQQLAAVKNGLLVREIYWAIAG